MARQRRADMIAWANRVSFFYAGAPKLSKRPSNAAVLKWLVWNDPSTANLTIESPQDVWDWLEQEYNWDGVQGSRAAALGYE